MSDDPLESFADLLDPEYQDHVIASMKMWCDGYRYAQGEAHAALVLADISRPLWAWIADRKGNPGNCRGIELGVAFAEKADEIVFILLHKTRPLYPEHIAALDDAWSVFRLGENPETIADGVLRKRLESDEQAREFKRQVDLDHFQGAGADAARKYGDDDVKIWIEATKKILKHDARNIKSLRSLVRKITKETGHPSAAQETIRKREEIIELYKKHDVKRNSG